MNERISLYQDIPRTVLKTVELMCKNLPEEEFTERIDLLKKMVVEKYCDQRETWQKSMECIESMPKNPNEEITDSFDIQEVFNGEMNKMKRTKPENSQLFIEFQKKVDEILHPEDADILETQSTINLIDPITKNRMTDPVKNVICNHTYDKRSISALIKAKQSKSIRCPYQGCHNETRFKMEDLVPDEMVKEALRSRRES